MRSMMTTMLILLCILAVSSAQECARNSTAVCFRGFDICVDDATLWDNLTSRGQCAGAGVALQQKLRASDRGPGSWFGYAVASNGDILVVGSPYDDENGDQSGSVYMFRRDPVSGDWVEFQKVTAEQSTDIEGPSYEAQSLEGFGFSVAVSPNGERIAVGARVQKTNLESFVSVYHRDESTGFYKFIQRLYPQTNSYLFGQPVKVLDNLLVVADPTRDDSRGTNAGHVNIYWPFQDEKRSFFIRQALESSDTAEYDEFGTSVDVDPSSNFLVVGANNKESRKGAAYAFRGDSGRFEEIQRLFPSDDEGQIYRFGSSVGYAGQTIVVGTYEIIETRKGSIYVGAVYVFEWNDEQSLYLNVQKIVGSDRKTFDNFGRTLALRGNVVVIGDSVNGSIYVYQRDHGGGNSTFVEVQKIFVDDDDAPHESMNVALDDRAEMLMVGVPRSKSGRGVTYVYNLQLS